MRMRGRRAVQAARAQLGRIDPTCSTPPGSPTSVRWRRSRGSAGSGRRPVHLGGTFLVCKHVFGSLREHGGAIVNTASVAALVAQPNNAPYGAAKAGIVGLLRDSWRLTWRPLYASTSSPRDASGLGMTTPLYT